MTNFFDICCPKCRANNQIDVEASLWVRLTANGTDTDPTGHEYGPDNAAKCGACGYTGPFRDFDQFWTAFSVLASED